MGRPILPLVGLALLITVLLAACAPVQTTSPGTNEIPASGPIFNPGGIISKVEALPPGSPGQLSFNPNPASAVPLSDTIVIGRVTGSLGQVTIDGSVFQDWAFEVESYVAKPQPETKLRVRTIESSGKMPVKGTRLRDGEYLLLCLKRVEDHFEMVGGIMGAKYSIKDGKISDANYARAMQEPLDKVLADVKTVARTWEGEALTDQRRDNVIDLALADPAVSEYLAGKTYKTGTVVPYVSGTLTDIRYRASLSVMHQGRQDSEISVVVNATRRAVDEKTLNIFDTRVNGGEDLLQIALADETVRELIGNRGYQKPEGDRVRRDSWQETHEGKTHFYVLPRLEIWLQPALSDILKVYVDPDRRKVVKIFTESWLSPSPLVSTGSDGGFTLSMIIPKAQYRAPERSLRPC